MVRSLLLLTIVCFASLSCDKWEKAEPGQVDAPRSTSPPSAQQPTERPQFELETLEQAYNASKQNVGKSTNETAAFITSAVAYADALNFGPGEPREKYPKALAVYDEVLAIDSENEAAKRGRTLIIEVYESMGMTPPKMR